jgi:hypothetical protein
MLDMFWQSVQLFVRGKLFQSPLLVLRQSAIGALCTALSCVALAKLLGLVWLAVLVSALIGGALQPLLFKNLKYN